MSLMRQGSQPHQIIRDHVGRQGSARIGLQLLCIRLFPRVVTAKLVPAVDLNGHAGGFLDALRPAQHAFDLTQLHPIAPELDHPVLSAAEQIIPLFIKGEIVSGPVHALSRFKGTVGKLRGGLFGKIVVSGGQPGTGHAQFSHFAGLRYPCAVVVDEIYL